MKSLGAVAAHLITMSTNAESTPRHPDVNLLVQAAITLATEAASPLDPNLPRPVIGPESLGAAAVWMRAEATRWVRAYADFVAFAEDHERAAAFASTSCAHAIEFAAAVRAGR